MKKTLTFLAAFLAFTIAVHAQVTTDSTAMPGNDIEYVDLEEDEFFFSPQYDIIKQYCSEKKSPYYYPTLVKRFLGGDTNMTMDDVHYLYYGSVYQKWYNPYGSNKFGEEAMSILNKEDISKKEAKKAYKLLTKAISENPTDMDLYLYRYFAATACYGEDSKQCQQDVFHFTMLIYVIANSGSGTDQKHAYHVINPSHSYSIMSIMGLAPLDQSLEIDDDGNAYDAFNVDVNDAGIEKLYFNVTPAFNSLSSMFEGIEFDESEEESVTEEPVVE